MSSLSELAAHADPQAVDLARRILEHSANSRLWSAQVGPALGQADTARLLGKSVQAVSQDRRLLRVVNSDGRPVYPIVQFDGRRPVQGVAETVAALSEVLDPLSIAGWLTGENLTLGGRPIDRLRAGEQAAVLTMARRLAARLS
ncbi:MAG: hypothetical protein ACT4PP_13910 [Sporichthyaceae bacterium]